MNQSIKITEVNRLSVTIDWGRPSYEWWLFIHSYDEHISSYEWNTIFLKSYSLYTLTYSVRSYQLLPSPYRTNCLDYSQKSGLKSRKNCIRKCKTRHSLEKCGVLSDEIDIYNGEPNVVFAKTNKEWKCTRREKLDDICLKECARYDCDKQYMEVKIIEIGNTNNYYNRVRLMIPFEPRTTFSHVPSIELIEFLCYLASTLGLWFGFSIISVYDWVKDLTMVNRQKRIEKFKVNNHFNRSLNASEKIVNLSLNHNK